MKRAFSRAIVITVALTIALATKPVLADDDDSGGDDTSISSSSDDGGDRKPPASDADEEEVKPPPPKRRGKKPRRRVASNEESGSYSELRASRKRPKERDIEARFAGLVGVSSMGNSATDPSFVNVGLAIAADVRAWKYVGLEADIHGDLLTGKYTDGTGTSAPKLSKQTAGGMINAKGQYPFRAGNAVRIVPKGGLGFGLQQIEYSSSTGTGNTVNVNGAYFVVGADIEPSPKVVLFTDYARSLGGSGSTDAADLASASYDRFRLGGYYRLQDKWSLGGQIVRRTVSYEGAASPFTPRTTSATVAGASVETSSLQFLGMLALEL